MCATVPETSRREDGVAKYVKTLLVNILRVPLGSSLTTENIRGHSADDAVFFGIHDRKVPAIAL